MPSAAAALKEAGLWSYAHSWLNLLLPGRSTATVTREALDAPTPNDDPNSSSFWGS
ncbi:hypothetical protein GCM10022233_56110 [Streptomyces shaanxiensis]|uniref:Uncharacterized protein n=1 Tax=Streptomyces shaanxiensis TaxID=653357 RepID=A0ABP7VPT6_9ACTN